MTLRTDSNCRATTSKCNRLPLCGAIDADLPRVGYASAYQHQDQDEEVMLKHNLRKLKFSDVRHEELLHAFRDSCFWCHVGDALFL
jgi:hypothetical protein